MSNKLEAALGEIAGTFPMQKIGDDWAEKEFAPAPAPVEPNTFTDKDGDTYEAVQDGVEGWETIDLTKTFSGSDMYETISFLKADAAKIIALIQEAAK